MPSHKEKEIRLSFTKTDFNKIKVLKAKLGKTYEQLFMYLVDGYIEDTGLLKKPMFRRDAKGSIIAVEDEKNG